MLFKLIKTAISLIFASICLIPALSEEAINIGNYPCIGLSIDTVDGVGILSDSNDDFRAGAERSRFRGLRRELGD